MSAVFHFDKKTLNGLAKKNIQVVKSQAIPAFEGDLFFTATAYLLRYKDKGFMRTYNQVLCISRSSWNPDTDLL